MHILTARIQPSSSYPRIVRVCETTVDVVDGVHNIVCISVSDARLYESAVID